MGAAAGGLLPLAGCDRGKPESCAVVPANEVPRKVSIADAGPGEDVLGQVSRVRGAFDPDFYRAVVGSVNEYQEGDEALGIAAGAQATRLAARQLIDDTKVGDLFDRPMFDDAVCALIAQATDPAALGRIHGWTKVETWSHSGKLDHDESWVVANIADTASTLDVAVLESVRLLKSLCA